jgi:DNA repair protein RadC
MRIRDRSPAPYSPELSKEDKNTIEAALKILERRIRREAFELTEPSKAGQYATLQLAGCEREVFACMFLNTRHKVIAWEELFYGTIDGAEVNPREIVKRALHHNAAAVILAHNHPSGNNEPSAADRAVTARTKQALALVDIRLLDHFVVAGGQYTSLAAKGWV